MTKDIFRNFFVIATTIYSFYKILNIEIYTKRTIIFSIFASIILAVPTGILFTSNQALNWISILFALILIMKLLTESYFTSTFSTVLFSFSFSFIAYTLSGIIASLMLSPMYFRNYEVPWPFIRLLGGIIHFILIYTCFRIPRLKKGMTFLYYMPSGNIGSTTCIFLFTTIILFCQTKTYTEAFILIFSSITFIITFILIYWWNYHLTQTYRKYLKKNEINSLNTLVLEKDTEIQRLKNEHDRLAHLIHKDNKLLPAFSIAVTDFLENKNNLSSDELEVYGNNLKKQLEILYDDRLNAITQHPHNFLPLPLTNLNSVDAVLSFMNKRASKEKIQFQLILSDDISAVITDIISEKDLTLILSELLENALYASKDIPNANIQIYLGMHDKMFTIKVSNIGKGFEIDTLQNLGISKHTSHQDTGGSGIGMMDIWMLKERYHATIIIDETVADSETSVQTCISILFNRKKHYIIHSDRYKDLIKSINRPDVLILSKE